MAADCVNDRTLSLAHLTGATVGRVANRIAGGGFELEGKHYKLAQNNGKNSLHGGRVGFDKRIWEHTVIEGPDRVGVEFRYFSPDGEEGFPAAVSVKAAYCLTSAGELTTDYTAKCEGPGATIINLTNHAYWNLSGDCAEDVKIHELLLHCDRYLPVDSNSIPLGELAAVQGTPFDFTSAKELGPAIPNIDGGGKPGLDHCFVVNGSDVSGRDKSPPMRPMCTLMHKGSGRALYISGTQPGLQVYTANWLSEDINDAPHIQHGCVALETQAFPDAINNSLWQQQVVAEEGETYRHSVKHTFRTL